MRWKSGKEESRRGMKEKWKGKGNQDTTKEKEKREGKVLRKRNQNTDKEVEEKGKEGRGGSGRGRGKGGHQLGSRSETGMRGGRVRGQLRTPIVIVVVSGGERSLAAVQVKSQTQEHA